MQETRQNCGTGRLLQAGRNAIPVAFSYEVDRENRMLCAHGEIRSVTGRLDMDWGASAEIEQTNGPSFNIIPTERVGDSIRFVIQGMLPDGS
jgi:hypothetical protein